MLKLYKTTIVLLILGLLTAKWKRNINCSYSPNLKHQKHQSSARKLQFIYLFDL